MICAPKFGLQERSGKMAAGRENQPSTTEDRETETAPAPSGTRPVREDELNPEKMAGFAIEQPLDYELPVVQGD